MYIKTSKICLEGGFFKLKDTSDESQFVVEVWQETKILQLWARGERESAFQQAWFIVVRFLAIG